MTVEIVTIGHEVLSGRTVDTNFAYLARALESASVQVGWHATVGDVAEHIGTALRAAFQRADAVIVTGGLGPTPDDVTRKAVATALGRPLQLDEDTLARIRARAAKLGRKLPATVETMALIPLGSTPWPNRLGSAPGILIEQDGKPIILLPGVPQEMEALAEDFVIPYLRARTGRHVETFTLRTAGVYESQLHERIGAIDNAWAGGSLAYLPSYFGVDLRVTVAGSDRDQVLQVTGRAYEELKRIVGPVVYAEGSQTMEQVVGEALASHGWTIAVAESCTGGLLAKRITDVPGASRWFERGVVTYSNVSKLDLLGVSAADLETHGAVSAPVAEQMAEGVRRKSGAQVGVGITGVAGPEGGSEEKPVGTVIVAIVSPRGGAVRRFQFAGTRATIRERSTQAALDMVRRQLRGLPLEASLG
jgi:nicotinamide-nucleotide amidase